MIFILTGHLGSGKSLLAVALAQEYMLQGKPVASNIVLRPEYMVGPNSKITATKLPGVPTEEHLNALPKPYDGEYDESKFGLLILDEAGTWLNSRDWSDKSRRGLFRWITHARKYGWDVALIVQDWESLDGQVRKSVCECYVACSRLDRIKIPLIGSALPRIHVATARYKGPTGTRMNRWFTRGTALFKAYDTQEAVREDVIYTETGPMDVRSAYSILSAWHVRGRYLAAPPSMTERVQVMLSAAFLAFIALPFEVATGTKPGTFVKAALARYRQKREPDSALQTATVRA